MSEKEFQKYLNKYSVDHPKEYHYVYESPLSLPFENVEFIGEGLFSRVFKVKTEDRFWIIKEGRYDLKLPVFSMGQVPLPRKVLSNFFKVFGMNLMPTHKFALEQLKEYCLLSRYLGFFNQDGKNPILGFDKNITNDQRDIRRRVKDSIFEEDEFAEIILEFVKTFKNYHKIKKIFEYEDILNYNFLPKEYLILSTTSGIKKYFKLISKKKETYYIIQEWIDGEPLGKIKDTDIIQNKKLASTLILLIILAIYMTVKEKRVIDSKPDGTWYLIDDWFGKTGNIFIQEDSNNVKFIDTRWLWNHKEGNILQKGLGVSDKIVAAMGKYLTKYTENLEI